MHLQHFYISPCFNHWRQVNMKMTVCFGHCQTDGCRFVGTEDGDVSEVWGKLHLWQIRAKSTTRADTDTHTHTQTHTHAHAYFSSSCDMSGMSACHTGHRPLLGSLWITPHNSLHGTGYIIEATDGGNPSESTTSLSRRLRMCMWRSCKQIQIEHRSRSLPAWPHLSTYMKT